MKKYYICFFLLLGGILTVLAAGFFLYPGKEGEETAPLEETEESTMFIPETETAPEDRIVINQEEVKPGKISFSWYRRMGFCWYLAATGRKSACIPISPLWISRNRSRRSCARGFGSRQWRKFTVIWNLTPVKKQLQEWIKKDRIVRVKEKGTEGMGSR